MASISSGVGALSEPGRQQRRDHSSPPPRVAPRRRSETVIRGTRAFHVRLGRRSACVMCASATQARSGALGHVARRHVDEERLRCGSARPRRRCSRRGRRPSTAADGNPLRQRPHDDAPRLRARLEGGLLASRSRSPRPATPPGCVEPQLRATTNAASRTSARSATLPSGWSRSPAARVAGSCRYRRPSPAGCVPASVDSVGPQEQVADEVGHEDEQQPPDPPRVVQVAISRSSITREVEERRASVSHMMIGATRRGSGIWSTAPSARTG